MTKCPGQTCRIGNTSTNVSEPIKKNLFLQSLHKAEQENLRCPKDIEKGNSDTGEQILDKDIVESLENSVWYWTDFSKVHYHPQSLYELSGLWMDTREFDSYGMGRDIFAESLRGEEIIERLRFFVEECDHIQGFQFIIDDAGGFSALAADFMESIADEYSNTPVLLYAVRAPTSYMKPRNQKEMISRNIHDAVSFSKLSSLCDLIVPVGLPLLSRSKASSFLCIQDEKPYHSSAIYAAAVHSVSLPFRMEPLGPTADSCYFSGAMDVNGLAQALAGQARQNVVAILDTAMPAPPMAGKQAEPSLLQNLQPLTPETVEVEDLQAVESMTVHGAFGLGGDQASLSEVTDSVNAAYGHSMRRPLFCHLSIALCPLPVPLPFPSIFSNFVGERGELLSSPIPGSSPRGSLDVHSIPVAARLRSSSAVLPFLQNRLSNLRRFGIQQGAPGTEIVRNWGFGKDEIEDMEEVLSKMVMTLDPSSQASSESD
uniref:Carboxypeptidase n=1 Tax=Rhizophora mucronata TaxID=61149 RepID=A0A2P2LQU8_RHIMU